MQRKNDDKTFIEREVEAQEDEKLFKASPRTFLTLLRNDRRVRLFIIFVIFALTIPVLTFYFLIEQAYELEDTNYSCLVDSAYRIPCGRRNITGDECINSYCCYEPKTLECYHYIPSKYTYQKLNADDVTYKSIRDTTPFLNETFKELKLDVREVDPKRIQIILHHPELNYESQEIPDEKNYEVRFHPSYLGVEIFLKQPSGSSEAQNLIFTTFRGPLIASENYWEWTFHIPLTEKIYGLGEVGISENETFSKVIYKNRDDHTSMPVFMVYSRGSFYGVVVEHDGPLEVSVLPSRLVILKSLAGKQIVVNLSLGPTPELVMKQQRNYQPLVVPYWVLGAHICRDGLTTFDSAIKEYKSFYENSISIQFASDCIHENLYLMLNEDTGELTNLIEDLRLKSHFIMSLPPHILKTNPRLYNKAVELDILYKDKSGEILNGSYLEQEVVYPDFDHVSINAWIAELKTNLPSENVDGFVFKDNWPVDESYIFQNEDYTFPYLTPETEVALNATIPWDSPTGNGDKHIIRHNKYGSQQLSHFRDSSEFLMISSYDYGLPEATLVQNVDISWTNLKRAVRTTLYHSFFGSPLISIPVCGSTSAYNSESNEELCLRWYITAATFPLFRISSNWPRRDPWNLATGYAKEIALKALRRRYELLPYYYTSLSEGLPLVRPMFYEFYLDRDVLDLDEQYMLGDSLLVAQSFLPSNTVLRVYLPRSVKIWYEFWGGRAYDNGWNRLHIIESDWVMFIRHGKIVPMRNSEQTGIGLENPDDTFVLAIALDCTSKPCTSEGSLKLTGTSLKFFASERGLTVSNIFQAKNDIGCSLPQQHWPSLIGNVIIYGIEDSAVRPSRFISIDLCKQNDDEIYVQYYL